MATTWATRRGCGSVGCTSKYRATVTTVGLPLRTATRGGGRPVRHGGHGPPGRGHVAADVATPNDAVAVSRMSEIAARRLAVDEHRAGPTAFGAPWTRSAVERPCRREGSDDATISACHG